VDQSLRWPEGIAKDVLVKIQDYYVPADFLVPDMPGDEDTPIILGRPFLNTTDAVIYIESGYIHFRLPKICCQFNSYTNHEQPKKSRSKRRHQSRHRSSKDGWAGFPGVTRSNDVVLEPKVETEKIKDEPVKEPRYNEWEKEAEKQDLALKEEDELMKNRVKIWKKKKVTFATPQEEQASEPSSGSDDATDK
jgi:hypothetical protein